MQQDDTNKWCSIDENERQTFLICMDGWVCSDVIVL